MKWEKVKFMSFSNNLTRWGEFEDIWYKVRDSASPVSRRGTPRVSPGLRRLYLFEIVPFLAVDKL